MNRRQFLSASAASAALVAAGATRGSRIFGQTIGPSSAPATARVTLFPDQLLGQIPADFTGLGYEISSVAEPGMFSGTNTRMIQFVRTLGRSGVIRIGGNTSDYSRWSADGTPSDAPKSGIVNRAVINDLGDFLRATGWKLIWGLNLGRGTPEEAADEAAAVAKSARNLLLAMEIGNEPDLFPNAHRKHGYSYADFLSEYRRFKSVVRARVPGVPLAGPDVAGNTGWVEKFAADESPDLKLLTHHHYSQGPPERPTTTIENLLAGKTGLSRTLDRMEKISASAKIPYRFCEMNSCFNGGKPGVADTFASALWVLDIMFMMASHDCSGVNIETGVNQLGVISAYSPIYPQGNGAYVARPIYYGMLAFAQAGHGSRVQTTVDADGANLKAYATRGIDGQPRLVLINKEITRDLDVNVTTGTRTASAKVNRLIAPRAASKTGVTLGGSAVDADGIWKPVAIETIRITNGTLEIQMPAASAAVIEL
jgi:hypothetical protein